tara:strand:- start:1209 stop:1316 length:108 start_codon:yes stop_codon:yes gene_type:complete
MTNAEKKRLVQESKERVKKIDARAQKAIKRLNILL